MDVQGDDKSVMIMNQAGSKDLAIMRHAPSKPSTTTISTIAMQSGKTKVVIALLQSGTKIRLKVLEMDPGIAYLGQSFEEAAQLQSAQVEVLNKLQSKQSPVEDLLRQADELIAKQRVKPEVYAAMAESLGMAWKDLNNQLNQRKTLLDQNYLFQGHLQDYMDKAQKLEALCIKTRSSTHHQHKLSQELLIAKKKLLEASVFALQEGEALLASLNDLWQQATQDSRPDFIRASISLAIEQVEHWLESIYDRRIVVTDLLKKTLKGLDRSMHVDDMMDKLSQLEDAIASKKANLMSIIHELGSSVNGAESMLKEALTLNSEAQMIMEKCLDIVKATQSLGSLETTNCSIKAYHVLDKASEYQQLLETRTSILAEASTFHQGAQAAMQRFDQLALQVGQLDVATGSARDSIGGSLQKILSLVEDILADILGQGSVIVDKVGAQEPGLDGIKQTMQQLETKAGNIRSSCGLKQSQVKRSTETTRSFKAKLDEVSQWVSGVAEVYVRQNRDLGKTLEDANRFLNTSKDFLNRSTMKIFELEGLRGALKVVSDQCSTEETRILEEEMRSILERLLKLKISLEARTDIAARYVKFLKQAGEVECEMMQLEDRLLISKAENGGRRISDSTSSYEESRLLIQQLYLQACNNGKNCKLDIGQKADADIDKDAALANIKAKLEQINQKQSALIDIWKTLDRQSREVKKAEEEWVKIAEAAKDVLAEARRFDSTMCPIIKSVAEPSSIVSELEERLNSLPKQKLLPEKTSNLKDRIQEVMSSLSSQQKIEAQQYLADLKAEHCSIQAKLNEYEIVLQMLIAFMKHVVSLQINVRNLLQQYKANKAPKDVYEAEMLAQEHEAGKKSMEDIFDFAIKQSHGLAKRMEDSRRIFTKQPILKESNLLTNLVNKIRSEFEVAWNDRKLALTRHAKFCIFATSTQKLTGDIEELKQLILIKTSLEETQSALSSANDFLTNIENNVSNLMSSLQEIMGHGQALCEEIPDHKATVDLGLKQLQDKYHSLLDLMRTQRTKLDSAKQYFALLQSTEAFLREANKSILEWSRQMHPGDKMSADHHKRLQDQIEEYIRLHKTNQSEVIVQIIGLAQQVFGSAARDKSKSIQKELDATFDALTGLLIQVNNEMTHRKTSEEEESKRARIQMEAEANMRAAKAEAEAARLAAQKAAEEQQKRMMEFQQKVVMSHHQTEIKTHQVEEQPPPRPPPPAPIAPLFKSYLRDQVLAEGKKCTMEARVNGMPVPKVTWFKDGVPVDDGNSDYKSYFDEESGLCKLIIDETFVADSANWSVRASNIGGYAESHAKLTVQEPKPSIQVKPPKFTVHLKSDEVNEGERLVLRCQVSGCPTPQLSWFKDGLCIDRNRSIIFDISPMSADIIESSVQINQVKLDHIAEYKCQATNEAGTATSAASINVHPLEPTELPVFDDPLINVEVKTGQPLVLECYVHGLPTPEVSWFHNNRPLRRTGDLDWTYDESFGKACLNVSEAFPKAAGNYLCKAKNKAGEATSTCVVTVKALQPPETSDSDAMTENENMSLKRMTPSKPAFYVPLKNQECHEGEEIMLECVVVATPDPELTWYKNNVPMRPIAGKVQILSHGDSYKLILKNVNEKEFSGNYKVRAVNVAGDCQSTCSLRVVSKTEVVGQMKVNSYHSHTLITDEERTRVVSNRISPKDVAPKFHSPIQGLMSEEGAQITLSGQFDSYPPPKVSWTFKGKPVNHGKILVEHKQTSLTIPKVKAEHAGRYICKLENQNGCAESTADLVVRKKKLSPVFLKRLPNMTVEAGSRLIAGVEVGGQPKPAIQWFKDDRPLASSGNVRFINEGLCSTVIINNTNESNIGTYCVIATNEAGEVTSSADFYVRPPPPRPPPPEICITDDEVEVFSLPVPARPPSPRIMSKSPTPSIILKPESNALSTLARHQVRNRPLPNLEPFPFKPDQPIEVKRKNPGKVPRPSKFVKGEMYHSDYDSDWDSGRPLPKWRPYYSDTEDFMQFKSVKPKLMMTTSQRNNNKERRPSPPCPHKWESHEEIEKLEADLRKTKVRPATAKSIRAEHLQDTLENMTKSTTTTISTSSQQAQSFNSSSLNKSRPLHQASNGLPTPAIPITVQEISSKVNQPKPAPIQTYALTPSSSKGANLIETSSVVSDEISMSSQSTVRSKKTVTSTITTSSSTTSSDKKEFISVKDKVKMLEQTMQDHEEHHHQGQYCDSEAGSDLNQRSTPTIRPEEIPGAVRVLPPASPSIESRPGSRKGSIISRSASADIFGGYKSPSRNSPLTIPRSAQPSPMTVTRSAQPSPLTLPRSAQPSPLTTQLHQRFMQRSMSQQHQVTASSFSDMESDLEVSSNGYPRWIPPGQRVNKAYRPVKMNFPMKKGYASDTEATAAVAPSQFETPQPTNGRPRPTIDLEKTVKDIKKENNLRNVDTISKAIIDDYNQNKNSNSQTSVTSSTTTKIEQQMMVCKQEMTELCQSSSFSAGEDKGYSGSSSMERHSTSRQSTVNTKGGYTTDASPPPLESMASSSKKVEVKESKVIMETTTSVTDSEAEHESNLLARKCPRKSPRGPTPEQPKGSPKTGRKKQNRAQDGYEADTDDTLSRRRKSVKDLARSFQQAEDACPAQTPLRPKVPDYSDYESDPEGAMQRARSRSRGASMTTPEPAFMASKAYVPPKWAPPPQMDISSSGMAALSSTMTQHSSSTSMFSSSSVSNAGNSMSTNTLTRNETSSFMQQQSPSSVNEPKAPVLFVPKKFVASNTTSEAMSASTNWDIKDGNGKIAPIWTPSGTKTYAGYRKIQPNFSANTSLKQAVFKTKPSNTDALPGSNVKFRLELDQQECPDKDKIKVTWSFKDQPLVNNLGGVKIHSNDNNLEHILDISEVGEQHVGNYTCTAIYADKDSSISKAQSHEFALKLSK